MSRRTTQENYGRLNDHRPRLRRTQSAASITCTLVTTLYATTITIANVSLPQMQGALSASPDQIAWIVTANLIATAVTIPLAGWLSDRFGRRRCMLWGTVGFGAATLMCGLSTSLTELVIWRVVQSAFGSPLTPISQSVVIDEFTGEKRGVAVAIKHGRRRGADAGTFGRRLCQRRDFLALGLLHSDPNCRHRARRRVGVHQTRPTARRPS